MTQQDPSAGTSDVRAPANWIRATRRGTVIAEPPGHATLQGWLEFSGLATNLDAIVDWSSATSDDPFAVVAVAIYCKSTPGAGKVYRAQYNIGPTSGVLPFAKPGFNLLDPSWSTCIQAGGAGGLQFLFHAGGIGALVWGLEMAASSGFGPMFQVRNLIATGIAHGREL